MVFTDGSAGKQSLNFLGDAGNIIASERKAEDGKEYYFYNKDIRISTTTILDSGGNCANSYEYDTFGETTIHGDLYNEICYTGGIYDQSTGLYYLNARYYNPADKRFLTEDTYRGSENDPNTLHLYAYCANNPVNYVDPSGHKAVKQYSAAKTFNYNAPLLLGGIIITIVIKWDVVGKRIVSLSSYVSDKRTRGFVKIKTLKRTAKRIRNKGKYAYIKYFVTLKLVNMADLVINKFSLPLYEFYHPAAIVYNDGGSDWYEKGINWKL